MGISLVSLLVLMIVGGIGLYWWANSIFNRIEKVDVTEALADGNGTNYLIVGSDKAMEGFDPNRPEGERSDTMLLLRFQDGKAKMMSIPRDLIVDLPSGEEGRLNGAYNDGPIPLIQTISENLEITIQRYIEVDFVSFAGLVDGLGGVTIDFPNPAYDTHSGLNVMQTGPVELDGEQALAYARSRYYTEILPDGTEETDGRADLGRIERQQTFLRAVFAKLSSVKNPFTMASTASKVTDGLRIDDDMTLFDAARFAWNLRGLKPESVELPVTNEGAVVVLNEESPTALDQFR